MDEPNELNTAHDSLGLDDEIANYSNMLIKVDEKSDPQGFLEIVFKSVPNFVGLCEEILVYSSKFNSIRGNVLQSGEHLFFYKA